MPETVGFKKVEIYTKMCKIERQNKWKALKIFFLNYQETFL